VVFLLQTRPRAVRRPQLFFQVWITRFLKPHGAGMRSLVPIRRAARTTQAGLTRYLTALKIVGGLLFIWSTLCAI
jgi:hypothetical protein